jgi:hypothetical protein
MGYARFRRPLDAATSCGLVRALAAEAVCEHLDLAGPPPVATRRDQDGVGEVRAVRQLVGGGPAKLEERADVPDADQIVAGPSGGPGSRGRRYRRVWRAAHGLPQATARSGGSVIMASAAAARSRVLVGEREVAGSSISCASLVAWPLGQGMRRVGLAAGSGFTGRGAGVWGSKHSSRMPKRGIKIRNQARREGQNELMNRRQKAERYRAASLGRGPGPLAGAERPGRGRR